MTQPNFRCSNYSGNFKICRGLPVAQGIGLLFRERILHVRSAQDYIVWLLRLAWRVFFVISTHSPNVIRFFLVCKICGGWIDPACVKSMYSEAFQGGP